MGSGGGRVGGLAGGVRQRESGWYGYGVKYGRGVAGVV